MILVSLLRVSVVVVVAEGVSEVVLVTVLEWPTGSDSQPVHISTKVAAPMQAVRTGKRLDGIVISELQRKDNSGNRDYPQKHKRGLSRG